MSKLSFGKDSGLGKWVRGIKKEQEYGPGKEGIVICSRCGASYYNKSWHHNLDDYKKLTEDKNIHFELCPADQMKERRAFEGEVVFENFPPGHKDEILKQVENIGERAYKRDPMDKILQTHISDKRLEVRTSENQLALSMAKQIKKSHKKSKIEISLSKEESVIRVRVVWL